MARPATKDVYAGGSRRGGTFFRALKHKSVERVFGPQEPVGFCREAGDFISVPDPGLKPWAKVYSHFVAKSECAG